MSFILYPTQLFELSYIPKKYRNHQFYLIEHQRFYGKKYNKKKIILLKASSLSYIDQMKKYIKIKYIDHYPDISEIVAFDPIDKVLYNEILSKYKNVVILQSPNFISDIYMLKKYYDENKMKKRFFHSDFYAYQLKIHNIPYIDRSYDVENRISLPEKLNNFVFPKLNTNKYVERAVDFVEKNYGNNYGDVDDFYYPIDHKQAKKWFKNFIKDKMNKFAKYQDAMVPEEPFMYHSVISPAMNIGLINPGYMLKKVIEAYRKKLISIKDYEAFVRQIIGWREYQRFIYLFLGDKIVGLNYFGNRNRLSKAWYNGTLGIPPVDDAIKMAFKYGFLHHILRLMVMCNFMNLCGIRPDEVYRWMMEFSVDGYEWVMVGNVYSMGMWSDGGLTMRKPYISASNYIKNMTGKRYGDGEWTKIWDALFYGFLLRNEKRIRNTVYVRNLLYAKNLNIKELKATANKFIKVLK